MKKILILVLLSFSLSVNAQSLNEIFLKIPDVYFKDFKEVCNDNLTLEGRKALLNNKKYKVFEIETLDSKNGYLSFFTNTDGEGMAGYLTYWRFQHSILAALVIDQNANCTVYSKDINFFAFFRKPPNGAEIIFKCAKYLWVSYIKVFDAEFWIEAF